eukprot:CAMPEP_0205946528 /NCGR_PEP_ID=MMETSP1325-20131115/69093_1 /ASSEMBLY_ACC=CAM_ASM_000708 /TAXON_ID=236786 /ORGANISM="Florenciella sp., Strain RCC1007" /LENGTH=174 /DNA_ID=CAMNT_0053317607 /DNA_START=1442 /DNA_END=1965 /DNA_ORIENTATION=+
MATVVEVDSGQSLNPEALTQLAVGHELDLGEDELLWKLRQLAVLALTPLSCSVTYVCATCLNLGPIALQALQKPARTALEKGVLRQLALSSLDETVYGDDPVRYITPECRQSLMTAFQRYLDEQEKANAGAVERSLRVRTLPSRQANSTLRSNMTYLLVRMAWVPRAREGGRAC